MIKIKLPYNVAGILETLNNNGFEAYAVGGCIRDLILGIEPKDYDVTTNAKPDEIKKVLESVESLQINTTIILIYSFHNKKGFIYHTSKNRNDM